MGYFSLLAQRPHGIVRAMTHARKHLLAQVRDTAGEPDERFPAAFTRLVGAIEAAFRHEESLMETAGVPSLHEQRRDNALLLNALHHALPRVEEGDLALGRTTVAALHDLLSLHRINSLRVLAHLQGHAAARSGRGMLHRPGRRQHHR